jgi:hypothetical protein
MILAAAGEADEVRDALKAGADATLKDAIGTGSTICVSQTAARLRYPRYSTIAIRQSLAVFVSD